MSKKQNTDHVLLGSHGLFCQNCKEVYKVTMPIDILMLKALGDEFSKKHINCKLPDNHNLA